MNYIIFAFIFIFGLIIGSFLNCLVWRLHTKEKMSGRSRCPKCKKQIAWYDNIPVLSFILLTGKCRHCGQTISWQYPAVEIITGLLFILAVISNLKLVTWNDLNLVSLSVDYRLQIAIVRDWFIVAVMIVIFIYDLRWYLILDIVTLPAAALVFIINLILGFNWQSLFISGIIGAGFFLIQFLVSRGKWIGGGDIRLGLLMGVALGRLDYLITAIFLAYLAGSVIGVGLITTGKKKWGSALPLGVFLSAATTVTLFWGNKIIDWYFGWF